MFSKIIRKKPLIHTRILSIDGGGVRGLVPAVMLSYLEEKIQQYSSNKDARIADYFDLFSGTSTGGLIVAALLMPDENARPKYTAADVVNMYLENAKVIFHSSFLNSIMAISGLLDVKYSAEGVELVYQQYFGDCELKHLLKPCLIPTYNLTVGKNYYFRQHKAITNTQHNYYLKDVLRAATAAITYFPPAEIETVDKKQKNCFIDGGIFVINPALHAYAEFRHLHKDLLSKNTLILSLGTGKQNTLLNYNDLEHWGAAEWRDPGGKLIATALADESSYQLAAVYCDNNNYLRINPTIGHNHDASLDNSASDYLTFLHQLAEQSIIDNQAELDTFVERLVKCGAKQSWTAKRT